MGKEGTAKRAKRSSPKWTGAGFSKEEMHRLKRRALIKVAAGVFREKGIQEASMDDIAAELNVSKAAIYYYVKDKKELVFHCHNAAFDIGDEAISDADKFGKTPAQKLSILIRSYVEKLTGELGGGALMTSDAALEPNHLEIIRMRRRKWDQIFRGMVQDAIDAGEFREVDPKLIEFFVMGAIRSLHRWYSSEGPKAGAEIAEELNDFVFEGLRLRA